MKMLTISSDKIALASFVVASLSIALTLVTIWLTHRHNKLTVRPIFKIIPYDTEEYIAVFIKNAGTGPLLRNKLKCSNTRLSASNLIDLMPPSTAIKWTNFSKFDSFVIPANDTETLIEIESKFTNENFQNHKKQIRQSLKDITIQCEYTDIYGKKFKTGEIKLDYCYGRHFK